METQHTDPWGDPPEVEGGPALHAIEHTVCRMVGCCSLFARRWTWPHAICTWLFPKLYGD